MTITSASSSASTLLQLLLLLPVMILSVAMLIHVIQAGRGRIVTAGTIKCVGLAGIVIAILALLFSNPLTGLILLVASILYRASIKNFDFAKIGAILAIVATVLAIAVPLMGLMRYIYYFGM